MMLVKTRIAPSDIEGMGLFADQFIPKGTKTWEYHPKFDPSFTREELESMPDFIREQTLKYGFLNPHTNLHVLCFDNQRFINHSEKNPNILSTPFYDVASKDIILGEEMTCNYCDFEDNYFSRRGIDTIGWV